MKNEQITNKGTLINSTNYEALIKANSKTEVFNRKIRKVVSVKQKNNVPKLSKVKKPSQRHR